MTFLPLRRRVGKLALMIGLVSAALIAPQGAQAAAFLHGIQANNSILETTVAERERELTQMQANGVDVLRVTFSWKRVAPFGSACAAQTPLQLEDPTNACYDWTLYDDIVTRAKKHKIQVLASIYQVPNWVLTSDDPYYMGGTDAEFEIVAARWAAFGKAAVARYGKGSAIDEIHYWTVGNEPNSGFFWHTAPDDRFSYPTAVVAKRFAKLYVDTATAMKAANGAAKIAPGPIGPKGTLAPVSFMNIVIPEMQKLGATGLVDAWAHNPYPGSNAGPRTGTRGNGILRAHNMDELFKTLDKYPLTRKKHVWATEFSYQTKPPDPAGVSLERQATFLGELYDLMTISGRVDMGFWYVFRDNTNIKSDWQSGLLTSKGKKKESFAMYARPVSRSMESVKAGKSVRIWGTSTIDLKSAKLMYSTDKKKWKSVSGQKAVKNAGGRFATVRPMMTTHYRITDKKGSGPIRTVKVK